MTDDALHEWLVEALGNAPVDALVTKQHGEELAAYLAPLIRRRISALSDVATVRSGVAGHPLRMRVAAALILHDHPEQNSLTRPDEPLIMLYNDPKFHVCAKALSQADAVLAAIDAASRAFVDIALRDELYFELDHHGWDSDETNCFCGWIPGDEPMDRHLANTLLPIIDRARERSRAIERERAEVAEHEEHQAKKDLRSTRTELLATMNQLDEAAAKAEKAWEDMRTTRAEMTAARDEIDRLNELRGYDAERLVDVIRERDDLQSAVDRVRSIVDQDTSRFSAVAMANAVRGAVYSLNTRRSDDDD